MLFDILFFGVSLLILLLSYLILFRKKKPQGPQAQAAQPQEPQAAIVAGQEPAGEGSGEEELKETDEQIQEKTRKRMQKEARRQEKKEQKEAVRHMIDQKEKKVEEKRRVYEEREKEREDRERKREEEEQQRLEEERKKEEEEYGKWKHMFSVEEQGLEKDEDIEEKNLMQRFIDYIKLRKVVVLEEIAGVFKLSTSQVIDRIRSLEELKVLNGVIDERGKYIYVTEKEMEAIANYFRTKGRVSRSDLLIECNKIIKLNPSGKDIEKLREEENEILKEAEQQLDLIKQEFETEKPAAVETR